MKKSGRKNKKGIVLKKGIGQGIFAGIVIMLALFLLMSFMMGKEKLGGELLVICVYAVCIIGGFIGGYLSSETRLEGSMITAAVFAGIKVILTAFNEKANIESSENVIIFLLLLLTPIIGGLISTKKLQKRRR